MKKIYSLLLVIMVPAFLIFYSFSSGSPGGKTGSTGDGGANCTQCHSGSPQTATGWISTDIPAEGYTPGQSYTITATGTHNGVVKFGFELTAEDSFGNKFGTLSLLEPSRTKLTNNNHAVTHTSSGTTPQGNSNSWTMQWTAPASGGSAVRFFAAFNAANGNGSTSGDVIYLSNLTIQQYIPPPPPEITSVDPSEAQQGWIGQVTISGENTAWSGNPAVVFKYHDDNNIVLNPDAVTVQNETTILTDFTIPEDAQIGKYDVFVDDLVLENGFTVDIYDAVDDNSLFSELSVYPNPAAGFLYVSASRSSLIQILDIHGKELVSGVAHDEKTGFNIGTFPKGIYFVRVSNSGKQKVLKIVKR